MSAAVTFSATKFYVSAFAEGLAQELKRKGAKMQAEILAPAATQYEFAQRSFDKVNLSMKNKWLGYIHQKKWLTLY